MKKLRPVVDLTAGGYPDTLAAIATGFTSVDTPGAYPSHKLSEVRLHAPLANPPRIFAIGLNYRDHAKEAKMALPSAPVVFFKLQTAIIGPGEPSCCPRTRASRTTRPNWHLSSATAAIAFPRTAWRKHVYGYTIINDVSARDVQRSTSQWSLAKSFPTFCPMGPAIVTADEIPDPHELAISLTSTARCCRTPTPASLIFNIPAADRVHLLDYAAAAGRYCVHRHAFRRGHGPHAEALAAPGDTVSVHIEDLGSLANPVVAE